VSTVPLFCDVDGVLNALGPAPPGDHRLVVQVESLRREIFPIRYDPRVVDGLNALTDSGLMELIWVSTWSASARDRLAPAIGLEGGGQVLADANDPSLARHPYDANREWWKLQLLLDEIAGDPTRPVIWADDDLDDGTRARWPELHPGPSLLITPDSGAGLTMHDVDLMADFVHRHAAS